MSVITLAEAKTHLNLSAGTNDAELQQFIDRAEAAVERRTGPLVSKAVTRRVFGGSTYLLPVYPVLSVTSVTPVGGSALPLTGVYAGADGVLTGLGYAPTAGFDVVYQAGHALTADAVPEDLKLAVLELTRHLWETQRGGEGRTRGQTPNGSAYAWPNRVVELIEPFVMMSSG